MGDIRLGTSSFTATGWQGSFYPKSLRPADYLGYYAQHFDTGFKQELCRQWREWVCPDAAFVDLIGMSATDYWRTAYDHGKSDNVRANALAEMRKL
jgi:hypothetical protein